MYVLDSKTSAMQDALVKCWGVHGLPSRSNYEVRMGTERIHVFHLVDGGRPDDVVDADDVLVFEAQQDLYLAESALAVRLVLERADLLYGHAHFVIPIVR